MELFISWGQCPGVGSLGCMVSECLGLNKLPHCFPEWLPSLRFTSVMSWVPVSLHPYWHFMLSLSFILAVVTGDIYVYIRLIDIIYYMYNHGLVCHLPPGL